MIMRIVKNLLLLFLFVTTVTAQESARDIIKKSDDLMRGKACRIAQPRRDSRHGAPCSRQIQIGHNVHVGAHTAMAACAAVSGSTTIGKRCMLGGQAGIAGHLVICDDTLIAGATMITKSISEPGYYMGSFPGEKGAAWKRKVARFRRLEDLIDRVSALEKLVGKESE